MISTRDAKVGIHKEGEGAGARDRPSNMPAMRVDSWLKSGYTL